METLEVSASTIIVVWSLVIISWGIAEYILSAQKIINKTLK